MNTPRRDKVVQYMTKTYFTSLLMSKDPSTKVASSIMNAEDFTPLTEGFNGMPRGVDETKLERFERPVKYHYIEHAERNAIYNLARTKGMGGSMALTTSIPHLSCIRAMVSVGVTGIVMPEPDEAYKKSQEWEICQTLIKETGTKLLLIGKNQQLKSGQDISEKQERKLNSYITKVFAIPKMPMVKDPYADATIFLDPEDYRELTTGYSGFPRGADDSKKERYEMPQREHWVEGSVRNAIYNFVRPFLKDSLALVTATTCVECARALASVGCKHVAYMEPDEDFKKRWGSSLESALSTLRDLNLNVIPISREEVILKSDAVVKKLTVELEKIKPGPSLGEIGL